MERIEFSGEGMALERIHLRKLLKILFLEVGPRRTAIRGDIRADIAREAGQESSGGDFHGPFWADAKGHVFGSVDLHSSVDERIALNARRQNLYPQLRDGFLLWWNERRRWTNEPFRPGRPIKANFRFPSLNATVKVDNILSVRDGLNIEHVVYSYFAANPALTDQSARLGLWLLARALPTVQADEIRILDIIRGQTFSLDRNPLHGSEEEEFRSLYDAAFRERDRLRTEYD